MRAEEGVGGRGESTLIVFLRRVVFFFCAGLSDALTPQMHFDPAGTECSHHQTVAWSVQPLGDEEREGGRLPPETDGVESNSECSPREVTGGQKVKGSPDSYKKGPMERESGREGEEEGGRERESGREGGRGGREGGRGGRERGKRRGSHPIRNKKEKGLWKVSD